MIDKDGLFIRFFGELLLNVRSLDRPSLEIHRSNQDDHVSCRCIYINTMNKNRKAPLGPAKDYKGASRMGLDGTMWISKQHELKRGQSDDVPRKYTWRRVTKQMSDADLRRGPYNDSDVEAKESVRCLRCKAHLGGIVTLGPNRVEIGSNPTTDREECTTEDEP